METLECIRTRASVRAFSREDVPENELGGILDAATQAPSAGNTQEWHFIVVKDAEQKKRLSEAAFGQGFVASAPVVVVVCADLDMIEKAYGERGLTLYACQDTAAAVENMLLAAWDRGIGSCWVGAFNEARVKAAMVIPTNVKPIALVPMGYPKENPGKPARRPPAEMLHKERWE